MFRRVLIANRGEIAVRIAITLRELGIRPVAVYSDADRCAFHTRVADEAVAIGPAEPRASYLNFDALIQAAKQSGAEAIHPGYGFLSENAAFAAAVEAAGLVFIGPTAEQIRLMGDKRAARAAAVAAGVPVVPGGEGADVAALVETAKRIGWPVMVKAALGGGGKGMRAVTDEAELREAVESAMRVGASAFGDSAVYLEKWLERPRHVEVQVLGDGRGGAIHLFERECSLQRRHQKVIEECPSPAVSPALREHLTSAAVALAKAVRYRGAGTCEFMLMPDGAFHFLEMNTRLQVEHPVTERTTGLDLVRAQLEIAATGRLPWDQDRVRLTGHAIEARVYAEDPAAGFLPQAGPAACVHWPAGPFVRVDHGVETGDDVPLHYDPMLAKIVTFGIDRDAALVRLTSALDEARVHGVVTNLPFLRALVRAPQVKAGAFDTTWIERDFLAGFTEMAASPAPPIAVAAAALAEMLMPQRGGGAGVSPPALLQANPFVELGRWRHPGTST